jgi:hypothetical protein
LESRSIRAYRGDSKKLGLPTVLTTDFGDDPNDPNYAKYGGDKGGDNANSGGDNVDWGEIRGEIMTLGGDN